MTQLRFTLLILVVLGLRALAAPDLPQLAAPGEGALRSSHLIYPLEGRPTPQCHASTIVETPMGLVAAWFGGTHEKHVDVGIWVARHDGKAWSKPVQVADGSEDEDQDYPCWNPVLFQPTSGPLMLFYKVGPDPRHWWGALLTSDDHGATWGNRRKLGEGPRGPIVGPIKNKPIQLADGSILCPSSSEFNNWRVHFEKTPDLGKTWEVSGPINTGKSFNAIQPSILRHGNDRMQVLCRSRESVITQSWSTDGGKTWGPMSATTLPNPNAGTDAVTLADGRQLLVYNHTVKKSDFPAGRNMLNVAISSNGRQWKPVMTLERAKGEFSYPAVIQTGDGKVHITYTWMRQSVKHAVVDPQLLGQAENPLWQFGAMADCQYCDKPSPGKRLYRQSPAKLKACVAHYNEMDLEYVVHLGDFIDDKWESFDVLNPITAKLKHPLYHVLGNHDFSVADDKKLLVPEKLGLKSRYYDFKVRNWRFVVVDGNDRSLYAWPKGSEQDRASRELHAEKYKGKATWNGAVGAEQLTWIDQTLATADAANEAVVLYCHFPVFPANGHNLWNDAAVIEVLESHPSVKAWINGHNHNGNYAEKTGIHYLTLKGMVDTEETSYASIQVYADRLEVKGIGRQQDFILKL